MARSQDPYQVFRSSRAGEAGDHLQIARGRRPKSNRSGPTLSLTPCHVSRTTAARLAHSSGPAATVDWRIILTVALSCFLFGGCSSRRDNTEPSIEFLTIPLADKGGTKRLDAIEGRVTGARPGQRMVLYARSGAWYVQPYTDQQFTTIQPDSTWRNSTHLGTDYAALLVEPDYLPPAIMDVLPKRGGPVVAVAITEGTPVFYWQRRWFRIVATLVALFALLALYRYRLSRLSKQLNIRFEERLAERTRIAQELHDTLLQGVISASMQLHVAVNSLPEDEPARSQLGRVQQLMGEVIEDGRNAVQGLRSNSSNSLSLEQAFSLVRQELSSAEHTGFRIVVEGRPRRLHPVIRDEVYRIGHEALVNAFRHARAKNIEVEVKYIDNNLRLLVSDDGAGIEPEVVQSGRDGHWGLSGMRERAERIGARLKVRSRTGAGTEVELSVPGRVAFKTPSAARPLQWFASFFRREDVGRATAERRNEEVE